MTKPVSDPADRRAFAALARRARIIPVVTIERAEDAVPLARALVAGGLPVIEVTLRTQTALDGIAAIAKQVPDAHVGAGTIREPAQGQAAVAAGARFIVSPGATESLLDASEDWGVPYLPGAATPSEMMRLAERGITFMKFFPAAALGGLQLLKSLAAPLQDIQFCPTGGIDSSNAADFLSLANVACVGGSWMVPQPAFAARNWRGIEKLAAETRQITNADPQPS
jgi:2-dehydro-3-deoxyphosphogluconate aldolase/(4S)-4-hydroxy-2-oxoglutarate aldolase